MAQRIVTTDDITDEEGAEPVPFGLGGQYFEIDLTEEGRTELFEALRWYIQYGRELGKMELIQKGSKTRAVPTHRGRDHAGRHTKEEVEKCRVWAEEYSITLPSGQGRIPIDIWEAWEADDITILRPGRLPDVPVTPRQQHMLDLDKQDAS